MDEKDAETSGSSEEDQDVVNVEGEPEGSAPKKLKPADDDDVDAAAAPAPSLDNQQPAAPPPQVQPDTRSIQDIILQGLVEIFPKVCREFARSEIRRLYFMFNENEEEVLQEMCRNFLNNGYKRAAELDTATAAGVKPPGGVDAVREQNIAAAKELKAYSEESMLLLRQEFRMMPDNFIRRVFPMLKSNYTLARDTFEEFTLKDGKISVVIKAHDGKPDSTVECQRLKVLRYVPKHRPAKITNKRLIAERKENLETSDIPADEGGDGEELECGCCYAKEVIRKLVQCFDGHLFCYECLRGYAKEAIFGGGKTQLKCMDGDGCEAAFPIEELKKCLPAATFAKYEERLMEESLNVADIEGLVRCPKEGCDYAAILHPEDKVFRCEKCTRETCRHCKTDWDDHFGKPCKEVEKDSDTRLRLEFEEKMTAAKVRTCHKCKAGIVKIDGCNKMTCRCGATSCYVCRQPKINYSHFCPHPRTPGQGCSKCDKCSQFSNAEEDDERARLEIQAQGQRARQESGFGGDTSIG